MNDRISANEFRDSLNRYLTDIKADPRLAQRIIASEKGEMKVKKLSVSLVCVAVLVLALTTTAFAVTALYRVINWQGNITGTADPAQIIDGDAERSANLEELQDSLDSFMSKIPDEETAFAWYSNDEGRIQCSELHETQMQFSSIEKFIQYMSGIENLTIPTSFSVENCSGNIFLECKAFGKYNLIESSQSGNMHYTRFQIDDSSVIPTSYDLGFSSEKGAFFIIRSDLREKSYDTPLMLRDGETARQVAVEGMSDALLIKANDPEYPDGLIMQRKLDEPVRLKQLPLNDKLEESDDRYYQYEYVTVWGYHLDDPDDLLKLFSAEKM